MDQLQLTLVTQAIREIISLNASSQSSEVSGVDNWQLQGKINYDSGIGRAQPYRISSVPNIFRTGMGRRASISLTVILITDCNLN